MKIVSQYRFNESDCVLRFDAGDDVIAGLEAFCKEKQITAAQFSGIGSSGDLILSYYNLKTKGYEDKRFTEDLEVLALNGNVGLERYIDDEEKDIIVHAHGVFSDRAMATIGGHVKKLIVSATCEIVLHKLPNDCIERKLDEKTGLRLMIDTSEGVL